MVKKIPLQNGMFALVDDEDYERCMKHTWSIGRGNDSNIVVYRSKTDKCEGVKRNEYLHRYILGSTDDAEGIMAFLDGNRLNFQKNNLRLFSRKKINRGRKGNQNSYSEYKGVSRDKRRKKWVANITINGKTKFLGSYLCEEDAAKAYNLSALSYWGEDAYQNILGGKNAAEYPEVDRGYQRRNVKNKTGYRGVNKHKSSSNFTAKIVFDGTEIRLGTYEKAFEAALAYDKKAKELFGDKAILNFPDFDEQMEEIKKKVNIAADGLKDKLEGFERSSTQKEV